MKKAAQSAAVTSRLNNDNTLLGSSYHLLLSRLFKMLQQREHKQRVHNKELIYSCISDTDLVTGLSTM
jgi:hypothetical protein